MLVGVDELVPVMRGDTPRVFGLHCSWGLIQAARGNLKRGNLSGLLRMAAASVLVAGCGSEQATVWATSKEVLEASEKHSNHGSLEPG